MQFSLVQFIMGQYSELYHREGQCLEVQCRSVKFKVVRINAGQFYIDNEQNVVRCIMVLKHL